METAGLVRYPAHHEHPPLDNDDAAPPLGPVSYTHLRAHVTVLALACRFLLEKANMTVLELI